MKDVGLHISELLFDHDCVIVPSLGGFLASTESSRMITTTQIIYPPYRRIAFNIYLKQNDGLLANHLVEAGNMLYPEALSLLEQFAHECFETLESGKKFSVSEVGILSYDREKNIQFDAFRNFNHLRGSFGLEAVHFSPRLSEAPQKLRAAGELRPSIAVVPAKSSSVFGRVRRIAGVLVVGAAIAWFSINLYMSGPKKYESTSLNPFDTENVVIGGMDSFRSIGDTEVERHASKVETVYVAPAAVETEVAKPELPAVSVPDEKKAPEIASEQEITTPVSNRTGVNYFVVAGVFKIRENAESEVQRLRQLGFADAEIVVANRMNYVSYKSHRSHGDALATADSLKSKNLEGWIWKH